MPKDVVYEGDYEAKRNVKAWFEARMKSNRRYNPTTHQKLFTSLIDLELAYSNSRSFRRLYDAVAELLEATEKGERGYVSPQQAGE